MNKEMVEYTPIPYQGKVSAKGLSAEQKAKTLRNLQAVVGNFYILEEMMLDKPETVDQARYILYLEDISQAMFDYLLFACWGEACYAHKSSMYLGQKKLTPGVKNGYEYYEMIQSISPLELIPALEAHFLVKGSWASGFGGKKWASIARALGQFYKFPRKVWFDHVVNLSHNGGLAFDKGFVWREPDKSRYVKMLDIRREGSLLESLDQVEGELGWLFYIMSLSNICPPRHQRITLGDETGVLVFKHTSGPSADEEDGESDDNDNEGHCSDPDCHQCNPKLGVLRFKVVIDG